MPGEIVTREELQKKLWPADTFVDFESGLNNAMKRLRAALDDDAESPHFIETLPRHGYRFVGSVNGAERIPAIVARGDEKDPAWSLRLDPRPLTDADGSDFEHPPGLAMGDEGSSVKPTDLPPMPQGLLLLPSGNKGYQVGDGDQNRVMRVIAWHRRSYLGQ